MPWTELKVTPILQILSIPYLRIYTWQEQQKQQDAASLSDYATTWSYAHEKAMLQCTNVSKLHKKKET